MSAFRELIGNLKHGDPTTHVGHPGSILVNPDTGSLSVHDGTTAGGKAVGGSSIAGLPVNADRTSLVGTEKVAALIGGAEKTITLADVFYLFGNTLNPYPLSATGETGDGISFTIAGGAGAGSGEGADVYVTGGAADSGPAGGANVWGGNSQSGNGGGLSLTGGSNIGGGGDGGNATVSGGTGDNGGSASLLGGGGSTAAGDAVVEGGFSFGGTPGNVVITAGHTNAGTYGHVVVAGLPTAATGLPSGAIWRDSANGNVLKIVP